MATDPKGRKVVFNYPKGAATMTRGLAEALFGAAWEITLVQPTTKTITVKGHSRTRVIGQPAKAISGYSYSYKAYPTMDAEQAKGGQPVTVTLKDGSDWTIRVSGGMAEFVTWLESTVKVGGLTLRSQRGTLYGPLGYDAAPALP